MAANRLYNERDEEIVKVVLGERRKWDEYNVRDDCSVYDAEPWLLFAENLNATHYVLEKLKKRTRSEGRLFRRNAGCGTWKLQGCGRIVYDREGNVIGLKKALLYQHPATDEEDHGRWMMHEYSSVKDAKDLKEGDYVLCAIKIKTKNLG